MEPNNKKVKGNNTDIQNSNSNKKENVQNNTKPDTNSIVNINSNEAEHNNYTYTATQILGKGSFGVVYQATVAETGETVAIKKVFQDKRYKNRELEIIKELNHPNVIKMRNAFYTPGENPDEVYLNVVMDYLPDTLSKIIRQYSKTKTYMPMILVKIYAYQMFRSLAYIHAIGICHRDIKPQNILIDPATYILRLCDFGSAKKLVKGEPNVAYICSRYYRAPELIFGATEYTNQIDVWSIGCVIAEMVLGYPIFPGESAVDQLIEVIKILGTPTKQQILIMNPEYTDFKFPLIKPYQWSKLFKNNKNVTDEYIDLISKVLVYEPTIRFTPLQSLLHPFFNELRDPKTVLPNGEPIPASLFNFSKEEIQSDPETVEKLIPSWCNA